MKAHAIACLSLLAIALASCGGGKAPKTHGMSRDELKAKLKGLRKPVEGICLACDGTGQRAAGPDGRLVPCKDCGGKGRCTMERGPALDEFYKVIGEPVERKKKDLIWEYWHYPCSDGMVRVPAFLDEQRGDVVRVVTGEPEPVK